MEIESNMGAMKAHTWKIFQKQPEIIEKSISRLSIEKNSKHRTKTTMSHPSPPKFKGKKLFVADTLAEPKRNQQP